MCDKEFISIKTAASEAGIFQELVLDAEKHAHISLSEDLESYLTFLLLRFNRKKKHLHNPVALQLLTAGQQGHSRHDDLKNAGDSCLLLAGLFPEQAKRRMVKISYFIRIGRTCYHEVAHAMKHSQADLYHQLCEGFGSMLDVLHVIHGFDAQQKILSPFNAYDLCKNKD